MSEKEAEQFQKMMETDAAKRMMEREEIEKILRGRDEYETLKLYRSK